MFSTAGEIASNSYSQSLAPSEAVAMVSGISYFGFLVGPPFIGIIAEVVSLRTAMFIPALLVIALAIAVRKTISGKDSAVVE
jgi:MFS family permease